MTLRTVQDIMKTGWQASLTNTVVAESAEKGNPKTCRGYARPSTNPGRPHAAAGY